MQLTSFLYFIAAPLASFFVRADNTDLQATGSDISTSDAPTSVWICECGDSNFLGEYVASSEHSMDEVSSYINAQKKSIFRNKGFWYVGDLAS